MERKDDSTSPGREGQFADTQWGLVRAAGKGESATARAAREELRSIYSNAIGEYLRRTGYPPANAKKLTREFFDRVLKKKLLSQAQSQKGRFRSFLLCGLKHFLAGHDQPDASGGSAGRWAARN